MSGRGSVVFFLITPHTQTDTNTHTTAFVEQALPVKNSRLLSKFPSVCLIFSFSFFIKVLLIIHIMNAIKQDYNPPHARCTSPELCVWCLQPFPAPS